MLGSVVLWAIVLNSASEARSPPVDQSKTCVQNEEWRKCGPGCPPTCDTLGESVCCVVKCVPGCFCVDGHIRNPSNKCVAVDACPSPGLLKFQKLELIVLEGSKIAVLTVVRVSGSHGRITVHWRVRGAPPPYSDLTGLLIFENEVLSQNIQIPVTDNNVRDPDLILTVELFEPSVKTNVEPRGGESKLIIKDDDMQPGYPEMESLSVSVSESAGEVSVRIVRVGGADGRLTVSWKTVGGTAEAGGDFINASGKVVFEDRVTEQFVRIKIKDDDVREGREAFRVELYDPSVGPGVLNFRARGSRLSTLVNIEDDDMTPGYPEMSITEVRVSEGAGPVLIRVVRLGGADGSITVRYRIIPGTARPPLDYIQLHEEGSLVFAEGVTEQTITVLLVDDAVKEPEERFRVELFDPSPGPGVLKFRARGTVMVTEVIISDNDMIPGVLELERSSHSVTERVEALRVWVRRVGGADGEVRVRWRTIAGVAVATKDFVNASGELVFLDGETRKSFLVHIVDDSSREGTETFQVEIFDARPGPGVLNFKGLGPRIRTDITIQDDDMNPGQLVLELATLEVFENVGTVNLTVVRVGGTDGQIRVHWRTVGEGASFVAGSGEIVFEEGDTKKSIVVHIVDNEIRNIGKRDFEVQLFDPTAGPGVVNFRGLGGVTKAVINIKDDDAHPGQLQLEEPTYRLEQGVLIVTVVVNRFGGSDGRIRVRWRTVSSAVSFVSDGGEIVFEEGETRKEIGISRPVGDFEIELFDPRPGLEVVHFRGLGDRAKTAIRLNTFLGVLELEESSYTVSEGAGSLTIGVVRSQGTDGEVKVRWRTVSRTAFERLDFEGSSGELVFQPKQHLQFISIRIVDDAVRENTETFEVELTEVTAVGVPGFKGLGRIVRTVVTITDDDKHAGVFGFSDAQVTASVASNAILRVVRMEGTDGVVVLHWRTTDSEARENEDYRGGRGELRFNDGEMEQSFTIQILPNEQRVGERRFSVGLFDPSEGGRLGPNSLVTVTIRDEKKPSIPQIFFTNTSLTIPRDSESAVFRIQRTDDGLDRPLKFFLSTEQFIGEGAAIPNVDFKVTRGLINFEANQVGLNIRVSLLPNPNARAPFKVFLVRILQPSPSEWAVIPGKDVLMVILRDELALMGQFGQVVKQETRVEVQPPPPPPVEFRGGEKKEGLTCPAGLTFKECEPSCQKKCDSVNAPPPCNLRDCVKGCFCPTGMLLDEPNMRCVPPTQCPVSKCPHGLTFKECAPACQEVCPGLESLSPPCHNGGCVKGCYCPPGLVLDHTLKNCVSPSHCSRGQQGIPGISPRGGFPSGFPVSGLTGGLQGGLQGGLPVGGLQNGLQGQLQGQLQGGLLGGVGGGVGGGIGGGLLGG